jgi:hypothetical protein
MMIRIIDDAHRDEMVASVYDTTYEIVRKNIDTIVLIDDSIVRGTTLEKSILKMLDKLHPKKIVIVSSAPQIRYPDCYGIDMSKIGEFIAFRAMKSLCESTGQEYKLQEVYDKCVLAISENMAHTQNFVQELYKLFSPQQISEKIALLPALEILYLDRNPLVELPESIATMPKLHTLSLVEIPKLNWAKSFIQFQNYQKLEVLLLTSNSLNTLPPQVANLKNLQILWLDKNSFTALPEALGKLQQLQELYIFNNPIDSKNQEMGKMMLRNTKIFFQSAQSAM